ncbi:MAG TPA: tetratricopeptide repeat protein, partial [Anaeromyxobacteraceae bacterium]|nr:tetratricopeptide repeat protein [Anaeromyxobacteraceae bacterium]
MFAQPVHPGARATMTPPNRTLTPSQLAQLEQAYANAPGEGWRALAEAYLARGKFMEALVVTKRGARARPEDPAPHLMLARVQGAQRKPDKARAAVAEALKLAPADPEVLAAAREHGLAAPEAPPVAAAPAPVSPGAPAEGGDGAAPGNAAAAEPDASAGERAADAGADPDARARWTDELAR